VGIFCGASGFDWSIRGGFWLFCCLQPVPVIVNGLAAWKVKVGGTLKVLVFHLSDCFFLVLFAAFVVFSYWFFAFFVFYYFVGLSLFSYRFICVAPVRGGTYFSLPPQRKVGKRKRAQTASL
jgi:hypothetical protein